MPKRTLLYSLVLLSISGIAQNKKDTVICTGIPVVSTRSTIEGFTFTSTSTSSSSSTILHINKQFFTKNFKLISSDPDWKVDGFWYYYDCEDCDIYGNPVTGNTVDVSKHIIFKRLKKGEFLEFTCINIERNGKRYITQNFGVIID